MSLVTLGRADFLRFCPCLYYKAVSRHVKQGWPSLFYVVSILTACLQFIRIEKKAIDKKRVSSLLVVSFYPIAWCFLMKNHTYGHFLFTFRIWGISIFALTLIPCMYLSGSKNYINNRKTQYL